jgi:UDP-N-acetyl-D-mannosaminuronate dehydrogenase
MTRPSKSRNLVRAAMRDGRTKVVVVGQGYVGLPVALRAAEAGYFVVGYEIDDARVKIRSSRRVVCSTCVKSRDSGLRMSTAGYE